MSHDHARTDGLGDAVAALLPALDQFNEFSGPDPVTRTRDWLAALDQPLPSRGLGADAVLATLRDVVAPNGLRIGAPGFCGWVTTGPAVVPAAAGLVSAVTSPQRWWATPGNFLEQLAFRWLAELVGLPTSFGGSFVSGGMAANFLGLVAARQHAGERRGIDPAADGVHALPEPRLYSPDHVHHVMLRSLGMLGLGRRALVRIATDRQGRPDLAALRTTLADDVAAGRTPIAVVASAGDVNTGRIDPLDQMRAIAAEHDVWFHVDGAYGGFGVLDDRVRDQYGDLTAVDSFAIDPHKWLAVPVGCGAGFVRDGQLLERALTLEPADYVTAAAPPEAPPASTFDRFGFGSADQTVEHSAPSRGLVVWAALAELGTDGMRARVSRHLDCARRVAERVRAESDLELLAEPVLSICCFRYHPPEIRDQGTLERLNRAVMAGLHARGRSVPSATRVNNKLAIRPCFIGPRATLAQADELVDEVLAVARQLA